MVGLFLLPSGWNGEGVWTGLREPWETMKRFLLSLVFLLSVGGWTLADTPVDAFGKLKLDQTAEEVVAALGKPAKKGEKLFEAATGETVQKWSYPKIGVTLDMARSEQAETLRVYRIQAEKPCQWIGWDGIGIGSPAAKAKAYVSGLQMNPKNEVSISSDSCSVLLTDSWTMLVFTLTEDKVSQIFLGPGPE